MNILLDWIDGTELTYEKKARMFLRLNAVIFGIMGLALWAVIRNIGFDSLGYAICFAGYPGFSIGYLGGFFFLGSR